jgi:aminopeptidase-like protein
MLVKLVETINQAYSGQAAKEDVAAVIRHHRIQASPGYRAAAGYVLEELLLAGLEAEIETYPANFETQFWTAGSFQEWDASSATLHLIQPEDEARKLCDYREQKLSLIQRSISFSGEVEIIALDDGTREVDYEGKDVNGKLVLTNGDIGRVRRLAVDKFGAAGILFDGMRDAPPVRETMDLPDALQYTSHWWTGGPDERKCFGFVLTPRHGARLRKLIKRQEMGGQAPVIAQAEVDARLYDGQMEVVSAIIPGQTDERILLVSHLCHPQPSANDNASGVAANLEAARTLQKLVASGQLPRPRRTIQFLWMPEMTGSHAYLSRHEEEIPEMIAGLNLDMVGEDQNQTGSVLVMERPPDASASFVPDLVERLRSMIFDDIKEETGSGGYSLIRYATTSFSGGSDHYIFSDPAVGVPMPMLNQWPDKFYHTSADTLDKVSVESLQKAGALASAAVYLMAASGREEVIWLAHEMAARFQARLTHMVQDRLTGMWSDSGQTNTRAGSPTLAQSVSYTLDRHYEALRSLDRLWDGSASLVESLSNSAAEFADREIERASHGIGELTTGAAKEKLPDQGEEADEWELRAPEIMPRRLYRGPSNFMFYLSSLSPEDRESWSELMRSRGMLAYSVSTLAEYWADGRRSVSEIVDLVELESGIRDPELIATYFDLLEKIGLVEYLGDDDQAN